MPELRINDYEVDLLPSLGRMSSYSVPVSTPRNVRRSITSRSVALLPPEPLAEQSADHYDGETYRGLPDGVWRFIEAPSVQFRILLGALSAGLPPAHVRVLPRSIGALGTREGMVVMRLIVLGGRGDSGGLPSGRALAIVGSFHHLELPQGAPADVG
jgi:hypothetical protein